MVLAAPVDCHPGPGRHILEAGRPDLDLADDVLEQLLAGVDSGPGLMYMRKSARVEGDK